MILQRRIVELNDKILQLGQASAVLETKVSDLEKAKAALEKQIESLNAQTKKDAIEISNVQKRLVDVEMRLQESNDNIAAMTKSMAEMTSKHAAAQAAADKEIESLKKQLSISSKEAIETSAALRSRSDEISTLKKSLDTIKAAKTVLEREKSEVDGQNRASQDEIIVLQKQLTDLQSFSAARIVDLEAQLNNGNAQYMALQKQQKDTSTTSAAQAKDLEQQNGELQALQALARRGKAFATTKLDAPAKTGGSKLQCKVPTGCLPGMLVVIGEGLNNDDERCIAGLASILVDQPLSRSYPIGTPVTIYDPNHLALTSRIGELEAQDVRTNDELVSVQAAMTKLEATHKQANDTFASTNAAATKEIESLQTQLASEQDNSAELSGQLQQAIQKNALLHSKNDEFVAVKAALEKQIESLNAQTKKDAIEISNVQKRLVDVEMRLQESNDNIAAMTKSMAEMTSKHAAAQAAADKEIESLKKQLSISSKEAIETSAALRSRSDEISTLKKSLDTIKAAKTVLEREKSEVDGQNRASQDEIIVLQKQLTDLQSFSAARIVDLEAQLNNGNAQYMALQKQQNDTSTTSAAQAKDLERLRTQVQDDAKEIAALKQQNGELTVLQTAMTKRIGELETQSVRTNDVLVSVQAAMTKLEGAHKQANDENVSLSSSKAAVDKAFALLKDTSSKTVTALQTQRNLDASTIEQLKQSAEVTQANFEKLQLEHSAFSKRIAEQDEQLQQSYNNELAQENRMAKLESQLLALEKEYEAHMLGCGKLTSSLQQDKTSADDRIAALEEKVKKGLSTIESLTKQLDEVTNNKSLADTRIAQLESQCKTDDDTLTKQVCHV